MQEGSRKTYPKHDITLSPVHHHSPPALHILDAVTTRQQESLFLHLPTLPALLVAQLVAWVAAGAVQPVTGLAALGQHVGLVISVAAPAGRRSAQHKTICNNLSCGRHTRTESQTRVMSARSPNLLLSARYKGG